MESNDFPQADDLEKVYLAVKAVAAGFTDDAGIETAIGLDSGKRQGRYYRHAAVALGFMTNFQNEAHLTAAGLKLATATTTAEKVESLRSGVLECEPLSKLLAQIGTGWTSKSSLKSYYVSIYPGSASTPERRVSTAFNYLSAVGLVDSGPNDVRRVASPAARPADPTIKPLTASPLTGAFVPDPPQEQVQNTEPNFIQYDVDLQKHERANSIHAKLVTAKRNELKARGISSEMTPHIDLMAAHEGSNVIYEMKSTSDGSVNLLSQVRKAVSQLHEYRYLYQIDAALCIVTDCPIPSELSWLIAYLGLDRGIAYMWLDESGVFQTDTVSDGILDSWM